VQPGGEKQVRFYQGAVTILLIAMALLLAFFLLQSRLTGTEPSIVGHKVYIVMSGSMEPAREDGGGVVVVQPLPAGGSSAGGYHYLSR